MQVVANDGVFHMFKAEQLQYHTNLGANFLAERLQLLAVTHVLRRACDVPSSPPPSPLSLLPFPLPLLSSSHPLGGDVEGFFDGRRCDVVNLARPERTQVR